MFIDHFSSHFFTPNSLLDILLTGTFQQVKAAVPAAQAVPVIVPAVNQLPLAVQQVQPVVSSVPVAVQQVQVQPVVQAVPADLTNSQFHAQDDIGQYNYGYSSPTSTKQELKVLKIYLIIDFI